MEHLDPLYDITSNIPGPVNSKERKWTGDIDSAWTTFWSIKQYVADGDSVFLPDMSVYRSARVFLEDQLGKEEVSRIIIDAEKNKPR